MSTSDRLKKLQRYGLLPASPASSRQQDRLTATGWPAELGFSLCPESGVALRSKLYCHSHMQGRVCLGELAELHPADLCLLTRVQRQPASWEEVLFLDTETTGLSGGTGTYVFLVGMLHWTEDGLLLRQYLMPDPSIEAAFIGKVLGGLQPFEHVATFNGKSFDMPLLSHRCTMNRTDRKPDFDGHHDLLHPARYLYRDSLPSCSLSSLEQYLLGVERRDDIPGAEIPERYFLFLKDRHPSLMADVVQHNATDLLSSAALAVHLLKVADSPADERSARISLALGRLSQKAGCTQTARRYLSEAVASADEKLYPEAAEELSLLHKRAQRWQDAVSLWREMIQRIHESERGVFCSVFAHVELAKYHEHRTGDLEKALHLTSGAIRHIQRRRRILGASGSGEDRRRLEELRHRQQRLQRRLGVSSASD